MKLRRPYLRTLLVLLTALFLLTALVLPCFAQEALVTLGSSVTLTDAEQAYLAEHPEISIAMDISWTPYAFVDNSTNEVEGTISNILDLVAAQVGLQVHYVAEDSYADAVATVHSGKTTLVSGIADDPAMAEKNDVLITDPYITVHYSAITKESLENLYDTNASWRVAVCANSYSTMAMKAKMPNYQFIEYHSNEECLKAVQNGTVDMALVASYSAEYYKSFYDYNNLHSVLINNFSWGLCFGVNKSVDPILLDILNKGIAGLTESDVNQAIYGSLMDAASNHRSISDWIYQHPVVFVCIAVSIALGLALIVFLLITQQNRIQELKREQLLIQDRDRKEALLNAIPGGIGIFEMKNGIAYEQYMNDSYFRLVDDTREARKNWTEDSFLNALDPEGRQQVDTAVQELMDGKDCVAFNYRAAKGTGGTVWIRVVAFVVSRSADNLIIYCSFSGMDEMVKTQLELKQSADLLEAAIKSADMSVWEYDMTEHRILQFVTSSYRQEFGTVIENAPDQLLQTGFVHPDCANAYRELYESVGRDAHPAQGDFLIKSVDSQSYRWERIILTPVFGSDGRLLKAIGSSINITDRKEKEAKYLRQLESMSEMNDETLLSKGRHNLSTNKVLYYYTKVAGTLPIKEGLTFDGAVNWFATTALTPENGAEIRHRLAHRKLLDDFAQNQTEGAIEFKRSDPNGGIAWAILKYSLHEEPDTNDIIAFTYSYDITERVIDRQIADKLSNIEYDALGLLDVRTRQYALRNILSKIEGPHVIGKGDFDERVRTRLPAILLPSERDQVLARFQSDQIIAHLETEHPYYFAYSIVDNSGQIRRKKMLFTYLDDSKTTILYCRSDITDMYLKEQALLQPHKNNIGEKPYKHVVFRGTGFP